MNLDRLRSMSVSYQATAAWTAAAVIALAIWWFNIQHLTDRLAWDGLSPTLLVAQFRHPEWFARDYPSGTLELLKSAPMWLYVLGDWVGIPPIALMKCLIGVEILVMAGTAYWFVRRLDPQAQKAAAVVCGIYMIGGSLKMCDLARFADPLYGWVYSYSDAAIMVGIGLALTGRLVWSSFWFAVAFLCHPILALFGIVFVAAAKAVDWRQLEVRRIFAAAILFVVVVGGWTAFVAKSANFSNGGIPADQYVAITRMESSHWYPVTLGLFWDRHWERLLPFMSEALLLLAFLPDESGRLKGWKKQAAAGFWAILLLTGLGTAVSLWLPVPMLIKLALHRSSSIALLIGVLIVVPGLWRDVTRGTVLRAVLATATLASCFICSYGVPFVLGVGYTAVVLWEEVPSRGWTLRLCLMIAITGAGILLLLIYSLYGVADWQNPQYWGFNSLSPPRLAAVVALLAAVALTRNVGSVGAWVLLVAIASLGVLSVRAQDDFLRQPELLQQAKDYRAAQLWANANTPPGTLFMPDPTHYYGWRDFSLRPSFGNSREWLYNAWAYSGDSSAFHEGLARVQAMGIRLGDYLHTTDPVAAGDKLVADIRNRYYGMDERGLTILAQRYGIAYFVFDKSLRRKPMPRCQIAYENPHYVILRAVCTK